MDFARQSKRLSDLLGLRRAPVAVTFRDAAPPAIPRVGVTAAAGCAYWKLASEGSVFYTEAADHYGCPVGAHTHGVDLPPAQAQELQGLIGTMIGLEYLRPEEIQTIPRRPGRFGVAVYAPLAETPCRPDVVLVRGNARQMMLLAEAAGAAGLGEAGGAVGRPTCAMIPLAMGRAGWASSLGCIGNRVYTDLGDDEQYFGMAWAVAPAIVERLETIVQANRALEEFHRGRAASIPSPAPLPRS
ncbi:MAG TPA: DUF169 domain-containing protein [Candidatus Polarisedimenticolia bacterium]|nr:DUF169 domain-containing protein [Candidatus Polarisedimenticolia bacterium]